MAKALLIAEKPDLMRQIQAIYKKRKADIPYDIDFIAQRGHLFELVKPDGYDEDRKNWKWEDLPFHPEEHGGWKYQINKEKKQGNFLTSKERFDEIKKTYKSGNYDFIINAGDPDQEGELLIRETLTELKVKEPIKRFWSNDLTEDAVVEALKNLKDDDNDPMLVNLTASAYVRQHSDYRYGMNLSECASLKMKGRVALGRVKTPILAIVCQREEEIKNFKPTTSYGVKANYTEGFSGQYFVPSGSNEEENEENTEKGLIYFETKEEADNFIKTLSSPVTVIDYQTKKVYTTAPKLYTLATIQGDAGKYGINPKETLEIIQSLYQKTYLSYPRTDCEYVSSHTDFKALINSCTSIKDLNGFISKIDNTSIEKVIKDKKYVNDKKLAEAGHSGLTPTANKPNFDTLPEKEKIIYEMVARRFIAIFLPPLVQNKVILIAETNGNQFKTTGKTLVDKGYSEIFGSSFTDVDIPVHSKGDKINVENFDIVEKTTTCPSRFDATALIKVCENPKKYLTDKHLKDITKELKIGTPATRADIINGLQVRDKYLEIKKEGKKEYLVPTVVGYKIWSNLKDCMICRVDLTAEWEEMLEKVRQGELNKDEMERIMIENTNELIDDIKNRDIAPIGNNGSKFPTLCKCPKCDGDILKGTKGYFCSNYKENGCKMGGFNGICDSKYTDNEFIKLLNGETIEKKIKKGSKDWVQKLKYNFDEGKVEFVQAEVKTTKYVCPKCGKPLNENDRTLFCPDKDGCKFTFWKTFGKEHPYKFTNTDIDNLLNGRPTDKISLISKAGNPYQAKLQYDSNFEKLNMSFD